MLIVGRTARPVGNILPGNLLATMSRAPTVQIVSLGREDFYRYVSLSRSRQSVSESVYVLPTSVGAIVGVCLAPRALPDVTSSCQRILGTVRLSSRR